MTGFFFISLYVSRHNMENEYQRRKNVFNDIAWKTFFVKYYLALHSVRSIKLGYLSTVITYSNVPLPIVDETETAFGKDLMGM